MKIGLATSDWAMGALDDLGRPTYGGAGWYRLGLPGRHLRDDLDFNVVEGTLVFDKTAGVFGVREWPEKETPDHHSATIHADVDLIVLQRWMFASVAVESEKARANGQVIVQDVDDHFWALDPKNRAFTTTDPAKDRIENRAHYFEALKTASAVTVSTPELEAELRRLGIRTPIVVIPNRVDVEAFTEARLRRPERASPVLGWIGATSHRSGDLETLKGILGPFLDRRGLTAYHGGHQERDDVESFAAQAHVDPERVWTRPMAPIDRYPALFTGLDVGLVPLRSVTFNRSKSTVKGLEYAASGLPFVAQDLPGYVRLHASTGLGRIATRPKDWLRHLEALMDPEVRAVEGAANLEAVKAHDIRRGLRDWAATYLDLLSH